MSTDIKHSKAQLTKTIQSGGFLGSMIGHLGRNTLIDLAIHLTKVVLPKLATKATWSILNKFERKISRQRAVGAGKEFS